MTVQDKIKEILQIKVISISQKTVDTLLKQASCAHEFLFCTGFFIIPNGKALSTH